MGGITVTISPTMLAILGIGSFAPVLGLLLTILLANKKHGKLWAAIGTFGITGLAILIISLKELVDLGVEPKF
jgi:hypothetical protein